MKLARVGSWLGSAFLGNGLDDIAPWGRRHLVRPGSKSFRPGLAPGTMVTAGTLLCWTAW